MPSKKEQGAKILAEALGVDLDKPPPPPPPPETRSPVEQVQEDQLSESREPEDVDTSNESVTLADLAELMDVDVAELYGVSVPMQDGDSPSTIGELKDAQRRARQLEKQLRGLESDREQDRKELDSLRTQGSAAFGGMPPELDTLRLRAHQWHDYVYGNDAFWNRLREDDPAQFAAEQTQAQRNAQQANVQFQQAFAAWQQHQQTLLKDIRAKQRRKLVEKDAEWADDGIRAERYKTISDWLREGDAQVPDDLSTVLTDPGWATRLYEAARAAQEMKKVKTGTPTKLGSAKLRRGTLRRGSESAGRLSDKIKRARETGKSADKREAAEAILTDAFKKASRQR